MGYMGQSTTKENLKLKKSLRSGRFFLTSKKKYDDYFHWEASESDNGTETNTPTAPYIELTPKQLRKANRKRLKPVLLYFFLVFSLLGAIWVVVALLSR